MVTEEALDFSIEAMSAGLPEPEGEPLPDDPWLQRRALGFGASDMPALCLALGVCTGDAPDYIERRSKITNRTKGFPRIVAEKARVVRPLAVGQAAEIGKRRERELLAQWRMRLERGAYYCDAERLILAERVRHHDVSMRCAAPWVDRHCPILTATLDAWADDALGDECVIELKCSATEHRDLPWYWRTQIMVQLAVTGAPYGLVVCGENWAAWHGNDGPIRAWLVERDEAAIEVLRDTARRGWAMVEKAKGSAV
jgi:hypothetical protein